MKTSDELHKKMRIENAFEICKALVRSLLNRNVCCIAYPLIPLESLVRSELFTCTVGISSSVQCENSE